MRAAICWSIAVLTTAGCTTMTYTSEKPAAAVSDCIANGWRWAASSGFEVPVFVTQTNEYHFVDVVLVRDFPTFLPIHSIWAKVRPASSGTAAGSSTEYRRNFQITHGRIDQVVKECQ